MEFSEGTGCSFGLIIYSTFSVLSHLTEKGAFSGASGEPPSLSFLAESPQACLPPCQDCCEQNWGVRPLLRQISCTEPLSPVLAAFPHSHLAIDIVGIQSILIDLLLL